MLYIVRKSTYDSDTVISEKCFDSYQHRNGAAGAYEAAYNFALRADAEKEDGEKVQLLVVSEIVNF